jgi:Protein of unknown function (DUF3618)
MAQEPDQVTRNAGQVTQATPATSSSSADSTDEIRARIDETRAEMSQTIQAIQERLSPDHLITQTTETVRNATVGRAKQLMRRASRATAGFAGHSFEHPGRVVQRVKENPVPVAVVGVAATWLAVRALSRARANAFDRAVRGREGLTSRSRLTTRGRVRQNARLLIGVGTGMACWGMWKARHSVTVRARLDRHPDEATPRPSGPIGSQPR